MKLHKRVMVGIAIIVLTLLLVGCVSTTQYEVLQGENTNLQAELETAQSNLTSLRSELGNLRAEYSELETEKEATLEELAEIKKVYPPGDFNSFTELGDWVSVHTQPETTVYLDSTFRSALKTQSQGLEDGYLISVMYDDDDATAGSGWVFNGALVDGHLYIWHPEIGDIYSWYASWLFR